MRFRPNTHLRAGDLNALNDLVARQSLQGASSMTYNNGAGVVLRNPKRQARRGGSYVVSADAVLAVVTGGTAAAGYTVSLYADGLDKDSTGTGILHVPECAAYNYMDLPLRSVLLAHATMVTLTGGSEA